MKHKNLLLSLAGLASIACLVYGAAPGRLSGSTVRHTAGNEFCPKSTAPTAANGKDTKKSRRAGQSDLPLLYGIAQAEGSDFALYSFQPTGETEVTQIFSSPKLNASGAAVYVDGKIYSTQLLQQGMSGYYAMQYVFDMETHEIIEERRLTPQSCATDLTWDQVSDRVYGQFFSDDMQKIGWGEMDIYSGQTHIIKEMDEKLYAVAADANGVIYAINENGMLETIDKTTGEITKKIGNTGIVPQYIQSATIDLPSGVMYWASVSNSGEAVLYSVDLQTAKLNPIASVGGDVIGLFSINPKASADAPAIPSLLTVNFPEGSLTGNVEVTAPDKTFGGEALAGSLKMTIEVGSQTSTLNVNAGGKGSAEFTVPEEGYYKVSAYLENDKGRSPRLNEYKWIGKDQPEAVTNLHLDVADETATLTWTAPTRGKHGGYVDPEALVYEIYRWPEGRWVAEAHVGTTFTEQISAGTPTELSYTVKAVYEGRNGDLAYSNSVACGGDAYDVPAKLDFNYTDVNFKLCTIIDANNDGITWDWDLAAKFTSPKDNPNTADDWMITAPFVLDSDRLYKIHYWIRARNGVVFPETYEVKMGQGNTIEAMTQTVTPVTVIDHGMNDIVDKIDRWVTVGEKGKYNIGFHALSDAGFHEMKIFRLEVSKGPHTVCPDTVTDLSIAPDAAGKLSALVEFTAPAKNFRGETLSSIGKIEIYRNNVRINKIDNPAPGSKIAYTDENAKQGNNVYEVVTYSAEGEQSIPVSMSVYVGQDIPANVTDVTLTELPGNKLKLAWVAPSIGANGKPIDPADLSYSIYDEEKGGWTGAVETGVKGTEWNTEFTDEELEGDQANISFWVYPDNAAGSGKGTRSNTIIVGNPYTLPFIETFPYGSRSYLMWIVDQQEGVSAWDIDKQAGHGTADGSAAYYGSYPDHSTLSTGKLTLKGSKNPVLTFWAYVTAGTNDHLDIEISKSFGGEYEVVKSVKFNEYDKTGWVEISIPLTKYVTDEYIHIGFHAYAMEEASKIYFDDVTISDQLEHDMTLTSFSTSTPIVKIGSGEAKFDVTVRNRGLNPVAAADYTVSLLKGDAVVATAQGVDIASSESASFELSYTPTAADISPLEFTARLNYDADETPGDNLSDTATVRIETQQLPAVTDLRAEQDEFGITTLTWSEPDYSVIPAHAVTEDFESYEAFTISDFGDWKMYDGDGAYVTTIQGCTWPNYFKPTAYQIFAPAKTQPAIAIDAWQPHSGEQYLISFCCEQPQNDDWLISPELSGEEQTVTFFAKTANNEYGLEQFEFLYSTGSTDVADFVPLTPAPVEVPVENWTQYSYKIPEGAKHFAIRCVSPYRFAFMLDDITFDVGAQSVSLVLKGYHVYRDGQQLTVEPQTARTFTDNAEGTHYYKVKVVYDLGESGFSNEVSNDGGGIPTISVDPNLEKVYTLQGMRVYTLRSGEIYLMHGRKFIAK